MRTGLTLAAMLCLSTAAFAAPADWHPAFTGIEWVNLGRTTDDDATIYEMWVCTDPASGLIADSIGCGPNSVRDPASGIIGVGGADVLKQYWVAGPFGAVHTADEQYATQPAVAPYFPDDTHFLFIASGPTPPKETLTIEDPDETGPAAGGWGWGNALYGTFALPSDVAAARYLAVPNGSGKFGVAYAQVVLKDGEEAMLQAQITATGNSLGGAYFDGSVNHVLPVESVIPEPFTMTLLGLGGLGLLLKRRS